jgi:hypothetical protein
VCRHFLGSGRVGWPKLDDIGGVLDHELGLGSLRLGEAAKDEIGRVHLPRWAADTELEAVEVLGAEGRLDGSNPVVATASTTDLKPETAEGEVYVVVDDQDLSGR